MGGPVISVVVPCYNSEKTLLRTINSINDQVCKNFELVIVDDGSTDRTIELARQLQAKFDCKTTIVELGKNMGVSVARNYGLEKVRGKYVVFLDSDDEICPDFLEKSVAKLEKEQADIWGCGYQVIGEAGELLKERRPRRLKGGNPPLDYLKGYMKLHICSTVFRKSFLETGNLFFSPGRTSAEDQEFLIRALSRTNRIVLEEKPLYRYFSRRVGQPDQNFFNPEEVTFLSEEIGAFRDLLRDPDVVNNKPLSEWIQKVEIPSTVLCKMKNIARHKKTGVFWSYVKEAELNATLRKMKLLDLRMMETYLKCKLLQEIPGVFFWIYAKRGF